jgi:phosphoribosylaminoimidazolecarboxamide formyltransferase/IMP cyclohydrolase
LSVSAPHTELQGLAAAGWELLSTGGTATFIQQLGLPVKKVEDVTGFPEMLDGALASLAAADARGGCCALQTPQIG